MGNRDGGKLCSVSCASFIPIVSSAAFVRPSSHLHWRSRKKTSGPSKRQTAVVFKENWTNVPLLFSSVSLCHFIQDKITWKRFKTKNQNQKVQARKFCNWHLGAGGFRITKIGVTVGAGLGLMQGLCWC